MKLALFPLPVFLLPGGVTRLRVFEQRYIRLVQESAGEVGFVIAPIKNLPAIESKAIDCHLNWGSWVKIIDFATGEDGLLEIDVQCEAMARIYSFEVESDNLKRADVELYNHWQESIDVKQIQLPINKLTQQLQTVFKVNPELSKIYPETKFDCSGWVCQRWLELLPLKQAEQNLFAQSGSLDRAAQFLSEIVFE